MLKDYVKEHGGFIDAFITSPKTCQTNILVCYFVALFLYGRLCTCTVVTLRIWKHEMPSPGADPGFGRGGGQLLRLKVANVAEWHCAREVSYLQLGSRVLKWALEFLGF